MSFFPFPSLPAPTDCYWAFFSGETLADLGKGYTIGGIYPSKLILSALPGRTLGKSAHAQTLPPPRVHNEDIQNPSAPMGTRGLGFTVKVEGVTLAEWSTSLLAPPLRPGSSLRRAPTSHLERGASQRGASSFIYSLML